MNRRQRELIQIDVEDIVANVGDGLNQLEGARVLITGASSYITAYFVDTCLWLNDHRFDTPCQVLALVRSTVTPDSRLGHTLGREDMTFIYQDVADPVTLETPVDYIIHAASNAAPKRYLANPINTMDANVRGTRQLLELARSQGIRGMLFFSSSEVYGEVTDAFYPTPETYKGGVDTTHPRAVYAEAKRFGETLCTTFHREFDVPVKIARVFFIYGPDFRLDDGRVIADFIKNRLSNAPIHLLSDGLGVRAFCHVVDAITGFWLALLSDANGEVFNIGSDTPVTIRDLATHFAQAGDPVLEVTYQQQVEAHLRGAPSRVCPDISKARTRLGFAPAIDLPTGIRRMLAWYQAAEDN